MLRVLILSLLPLTFGSSCNLPPELWCSSVQIAAECKVLEQCSRYLSTANTSPVQLTLYMESLCPDCKNFIAQQLWPTWRLLLETKILNLTLVPYGNAREMKVGDKYKYVCQHGEEECYGNLLETCALHYNTTDEVFPFINCLEHSHDTPRKAAEQCASQFGMDYALISGCADGSLGNALEHVMAQRTDALNPQHKYVPWITLNGVHTEDIQNKAQNNLKQLICNTYTGTKPRECERLRQRPANCLRV